ncbi:MAG: DUF2244 domain-containing protein [Methylophilaceae bacterium]|nr:DUF2244 domain-containing protein [Methylophilaceae bacterium]
MVSESGATGKIDYSITARPNCSLTPSQKIGVFIAIALFPLVVATGFTLAGAWLVFPFAGLELLALGVAFYVVHRHSTDYESITIAGNDLAIERRFYNNISRVVFNRYWTYVVLKKMPGGEHKLWLRSRGKQVEFGRYMDNEARQALASQLKRRIGATHHHYGEIGE